MTAEKWLRNTQENVFLAPSLIPSSCYQEWKGVLKPLARHGVVATWHQLAWARDGLSNVCFNSSGVAVMCYSVALKETTSNISTFVFWNGTQRWKSCLNMAHYQTLVSLLVVVIIYLLMAECRTPADDHPEGRRHSSLWGNTSCLRPCLWDTRHQQKRKVCVQ